MATTLAPRDNRTSTVPFGPRRATHIDITTLPAAQRSPLSPEDLARFESLDLIYRSLCAVLYNYVPQSGHPGGSISSGRFVQALLFDAMDYDVSNPDREDADIISYSAGHKALGLYALWALRDEILSLGAPHLLPADEKLRLRLEDLLGFRRNPITGTPLFLRYHSKPLDGHPTPATPFVRLSTGASGVGVGSSIGLALGARDYWIDAPKVHIVEGEGGLTPGRVSEALASAGTSSLGNVILHLDWNQASIDSDRVCRDGRTPGDYVQWSPAELFWLHDWNVIEVPDGTNFQEIVAAQRAAARLDNGQPTAIIYRTVKGWQYGIEGRQAHGAGHKLCSNGFHASVQPLFDDQEVHLPVCEGHRQCCHGGLEEDVLEGCFWEALRIIRKSLKVRPAVVIEMAMRTGAASERLEARKRTPRPDAPGIDAVYEALGHGSDETPEPLRLEAGQPATLRGELGRALGYLNTASGGALLTAAADLLGSTSVNAAAIGFPPGFYNARTNPGSRLLSIGGICEDAMSAMLSGVSTYGRHIGVGSSYGAFLAPLGHIAARLHAIGSQARRAISPEPYNPFILVCAHAGLKTGEDGPTHADPQALQLLQENFAPGTFMTLTPWDPREIWPLLATALRKRPAVIAPFVTRPAETVLDRKARGLAPVDDVSKGVYRLRAAHGEPDAVIVLQESGVTYAFLEEALPRLEKDGIDLDVYYVASAELFDTLSAEERERILPEKKAIGAMGITGFTLPTMYRWIRSDFGRSHTLHPFRNGHYPGSGQAPRVLAEAGLDGEGQYNAIRKFVEAASRRG